MREKKRAAIRTRASHRCDYLLTPNTCCSRFFRPNFSSISRISTLSHRPSIHIHTCYSRIFIFFIFSYFIKFFANFFTIFRQILNDVDGRVELFLGSHDAFDDGTSPLSPTRPALAFLPHSVGPEAGQERFLLLGDIVLAEPPLALSLGARTIAMSKKKILTISILSTSSCRQF